MQSDEQARSYVLQSRFLVGAYKQVLALQNEARPRTLTGAPAPSTAYDEARAHDGGRSLLAPLIALVRLAYLPSFAVAGITGWVIFVAVADLERQGRLGAVLAAGGAELVAPGLLVLVLVTALCEQIWPAERHRVLARGHVQDACFFFLHALLVVPMMTLLGVGFAALISQYAGFIEVPWTTHMPLWAVLFMTLVAMDGANWLAHYADHRLTPLWRFHAVHHTQEELSVLTSFRAHPFAHTTGFLLTTIPVVALMGNRPMVPALITTYVCLGTLQHANLRWTYGPLGCLLVSPSYHRLHHSQVAQGINLGIVLTIWDVIAGRARFPARNRVSCRTGLGGRPLKVEQAGPRLRPLPLLAEQLLEPFSSGHSSVSRLSSPTTAQLHQG